ncbi:putative Aminopeptidase [Nostocoides japonicum T1-X7]|uniref:Putative Aminopeptidase n=1 Tax=Nostocoides japonicum T1-X7 TaxID=1194083 RepID=A0A077M6Q7_9MICO|nr:Xaa-Pro peptidase family protein [Tetrasphaera japonica]CCH79859.1 putative Aminopeptidase [Tetrasphaera japonica T1-X7]
MGRILDTARDRVPAPLLDASRVEPAALGLDIVGRCAEIDERAMGLERLAKLRAELARRDYAGALLSDPINIRYATGSRNMAVWTMHAPGRYAFVATDGPVVLFEYGTPTQMAAQGVFDLPTVDEVRPAISWFHFMAGPRVPEKTRLWAADVIDLVRRHGGSNPRLAVDRCEPWGAQLLIDAGIRLFDAQEPMERARVIKTPEELKCLQLAVDVCDIGIDRMRRALRAGISENQLYSILHETNVAHDGEWVECRLLSSGERTNPWFQECSNRIIEPGDMVAFDTDMVGPFGYLADLSRSWVCPGRKPTAEQRKLYEIAQEQVLTNIELITPGLSFREYVERCWPIPEEYIPGRYSMTLHGSGMVDEYPTVTHAVDWDTWGFDGTFEEGMVLSIESYIGAVGAKEGVKLEEQVQVTSAGAVRMSQAPLTDALVA